MHWWKEYSYSIYSKSIGILFEYIHGRRGAMVEAELRQQDDRAARLPPEEVVDIQHGHTQQIDRC